MANYKVSYKVLSQQGEVIKGIAKEVDGYASRVDNIRSKLGDDDLLREIRQNLQKLSQQLGESRMVLSMAADVVEKCVEGYSGTEQKVVKKVDRVKAHNRDFYKNPVVVASAGVVVAAGGAMPASAAAMPSAAAAAPVASAAPVGAAPDVAPAAAETTVNVTMVNSETTTVNITGAAPAASAPAAEMPAAAPMGAARSIADVATATAATGGAGLFGAAAMGAAAAGGAAAGAAGLVGAQKLHQFLKDKKQEELKKKSADTPKPAPEKPAQEEEDPEILLERALKEAAKYRKLEEDSKPTPPDNTPKIGG